MIARSNNRPLTRGYSCVGIAPAAILIAIVLLLRTYSPAYSAGNTGEFDYYVLALSWSPTYCTTAGRSADPLQCRASKPHRFVVHGLWPQYERGWPDFCRSQNADPDRQTISDILDIMPSRGLAKHQWRKHGTCSGLSSQDYFNKTRSAFEAVRIPAAFQTIDRPGKIAPDAVEQAFRLSNPGLKDAAMAVTCARGQLKEVRICLDKNLEFRTCRAVDRSGCRAKRLTVTPPKR